MIYNWSNYNILIAEDDEISYRYLSILLSRKTNINIIWAQDGKIAIDNIKKNSDIDLILTDLSLPEADGYQIIKAAKKHKPHIPIIVQSAYNQNEIQEKCFSLGCDGFVSKPVSPNSLLESISKNINTITSKAV